MRKLALVAVACAATVLAVASAPAYAQTTDADAVKVLGLADTNITRSANAATSTDGNTTDEAKETAAAQPATPAPVMVTVEKGDSLSKIAKAHNTTWTRLFDANTTISDPNVINPGDQIRIPEPNEQLAHREAPKAAPAPKPAANTTRSSKKTRPAAPPRLVRLIRCRRTLPKPSSTLARAVTTRMRPIQTVAMGSDKTVMV